MATSTPEQERYILHLNHALAMESALIEHLEKRAQQVAKPAARQRIEQHRQETGGHRERLRALVQTLGATPTTSQAGVQPPITPSLTGRFKGTLESEKEDQLLLEALADYAVENYESAIRAWPGWRKISAMKATFRNLRPFAKKRKRWPAGSQRTNRKWWMRPFRPAAKPPEHASLKKECRAKRSLFARHSFCRTQPD